MDNKKKDDVFYVCTLIEFIAGFNTSVYYSNPDYLRCCYEDGYLLD